MAKDCLQEQDQDNKDAHHVEECSDRCQIVAFLHENASVSESLFKFAQDEIKTFSRVCEEDSDVLCPDSIDDEMRCVGNPKMCTFCCGTPYCNSKMAASSDQVLPQLPVVCGLFFMAIALF
ncbi:uncharacterized protein [Amphiura filiformis]|uniref:uncharacterized protein n=1 Tax=Amphiura filiformis TaxID=82378 RepID=UPI003B20DFC1